MHFNNNYQISCEYVHRNLFWFALKQSVHRLAVIQLSINAAAVSGNPEIGNAAPTTPTPNTTAESSSPCHALALHRTGAIIDLFAFIPSQA
jgi:hypothetical protein